jgi:hypothetical protein
MLTLLGSGRRQGWMSGMMGPFVRANVSKAYGLR